jgi:tetratricopeptide (TPR) repeat protein
LASAAPAERYGVTSEFSLPSQAWAGEVFALSHRLVIPQKYFYSLASGIDWSPPALTIETWSPPEKKAAGAGDAAVFEFLTRSRAVALAPGTLELEPVAQAVTLNTGSSRYGNYVRPNLEEASASSARVKMWVRPLPPVPADAGTFTGAVGHFTLSSKVVPDDPAVGKAVTWSVTFSGSGNWPAIKQLPPRALPPHFNTLKSLRTAQLKGRSRFDGTLTEDLVIVPTEPGRVTLGPINWSYFDPQLERYLTLTAEAVDLNVAPAAQPPRPATATSWQVQGADTGKEGAAEAPKLPAPALRDPIPSQGDAAVPALPATLWTEGSGILAALVLAWIFLAWWRMRRRDPLQPRREARHRALHLLDELARTSESARVIALLERWQRATADLWVMRQAVPVPAAFEPSAEWRRLWREANVARFSRSTPLPADWIVRARAAVVARRVPPLRPWGVFRPRHLIPLLVFAVAAEALPVHAVSTESLYRSGNFAAAEADWRTAVQRRPLDPAAHHNLALALEQQGKVAEAAAQAAVAFTQCPTDPVVRWDLGVTWRKARFGTPELVAFLNQDPAALWAQSASIARWQQGVIAGAALAMLGLVGLLWIQFCGGPRARFRWAWSVVSLGAVALLGSGVALHQFGELTRPTAALVWRESPLRSIPTEVGGTQDDPTISPGTIIRVDDQFLTWSHLTLANGQTGWLRSNLFVSLWK